MTSEFSDFTARLREFLQNTEGGFHPEPPHVGCYETRFNELALELFRVQFMHNASYRRFCELRRVSPEEVSDWSEIPAIPAAAFKEFDLSCLPVAERTSVFHSSGTTGQRPSRHFHSTESLAIYEAFLWPWFAAHVLPDSQSPITGSRLAILTPPPTQVPHSSLVHMFETVRRSLGAPETAFVGNAIAEGTWTVACDTALRACRSACDSSASVVLLGTAYSFVHLLDWLIERDLCLRLPAGSRAMETGGYKGRSRTLPKAELHALITQRIGIPPSHIVCEYGMSELSSQAYDRALDVSGNPPPATRHFRFPPWARAQIISPESGCEAGNGETGLIRVFDLANVFSCMAIQTEDLGIRRGEGFELIGRPAFAESRGCSLMTG